MKGAEATIIIESGVVRKIRVSKSYRHPQLDKQLTRRRTRAEAKMLTRLEALDISAPKLISLDEEFATITMQEIDAPMVRDVVNENSIESVGVAIGSELSKLHDADIIHGDLTTSNMLFADGVLSFIDFGLSYMSRKDEDKAVDLHLLKHAIDSTHYMYATKLFDTIITAYSQKENKTDILKRFAQVELRGRNKGHN